MLIKKFDATDGTDYLGALNASEVVVDTTNFDNNLSSSDSDLQTALETLDELSSGGSLPEGTENQTLRHNGETWEANSILTINDENANYDNGVLVEVYSEGSGFLGSGADFVVKNKQTGLAGNYNIQQSKVFADANGNVGLIAKRNYYDAEDNEIDAQFDVEFSSIVVKNSLFAESEAPDKYLGVDSFGEFKAMPDPSGSLSNQSDDIVDVNVYPTATNQEKLLPITGSLEEDTKYLLTWYIKCIPDLPYNADFGDNVLQYYNPDATTWVEIDDWDTGAIYSVFSSCLGANPCMDFEQGFNVLFKGSRIVKPTLEGTDYKIKLRMYVKNGYGNYLIDKFHYDIIKLETN